MTSALNAAVSFARDRIRLNALLIVLCFAGVLMLESQSAASYPAYLLAIAMLVRFRQWADVFAVPLMWTVAALLAYLVLTQPVVRGQPTRRCAVHAVTGGAGVAVCRCVR